MDQGRKTNPFSCIEWIAPTFSRFKQKQLHEQSLPALPVQNELHIPKSTNPLSTKLHPLHQQSLPSNSSLLLILDQRREWLLWTLLSERVAAKRNQVSIIQVPSVL